MRVLMHSCANIKWIKFNAGVLEEAKRKDLHSLEERLFFYSVTHSNLEEFMMTKYPRLVNSGTEYMTVYTKARRHYENLVRSTWEFIDKHNILCSYDDLDDDEQDEIEMKFNTRIWPIIEPNKVPKFDDFMPETGVYAVFFLNDGRAIYIHITEDVSKFLKTGDKILSVDNLICKLAPDKMGISPVKTFLFAVTRSAELSNASKYNTSMEMIHDTLEYRKNAWITRVRVKSDMSKYDLDHNPILDLLIIDKRWMIPAYHIDTEWKYPVALEWMKSFEGKWFKSKHRSDLPKPVDPFPNKKNLFDAIRKKDYLLFHPYESFRKSVVRLVEEAASDKKVTDIKITLYRVSSHSKLIEALLKAAKKGKSVSVIIELKARFDESHNMDISEMLEKAGIHIIYTPPEIKTHAKMCVITRKESGKNRYYSHIGTGNYSESNGKAYTDYSYFTYNQKIGKDLTHLFGLIESGGEPFRSKEIIYAPYNMRKIIKDLIEREIERAEKSKNGCIFCKCNAITDLDIAKKIEDAASKGVRICLLVRGACIIRPQKNIEIYSVIGSYLEHSRFYIFGRGKQATILMGSSDLMHRNLSRRYEVLLNIENPEMRKMLMDHARIYLDDTVCRRMYVDYDTGYQIVGELDAFKKYKKLNCQSVFYKQAVKKHK